MTAKKRSTAKRSTATSAAKKRTSVEEQLEYQLDGAQYYNKEHRPYNFMAGSDGLRPNETTKPSGTMVVDLCDGIKGRVIPPRFIWDKGGWKGVKAPDFNIWVVSGEGTPGNYETREYKVPDRIAREAEAEHPADWFPSEKEGRTTGGSSSQSSWGGSGKADSLPWGLRIRCLGCGHFFKESDLKTHVQSACPSKQGDVVLWIVECECHPDDLLAACEILDGFPMKPPGLPSGAAEGNGKENSEDRGSAEPASKASAATG